MWGLIAKPVPSGMPRVGGSKNDCNFLKLLGIGRVAPTTHPDAADTGPHTRATPALGRKTPWAPSVVERILTWESGALSSNHSTRCSWLAACTVSCVTLGRFLSLPAPQLPLK